MIMGAVSAQRWCYACAKQLVERLIYAHGSQNGLKFTIVRPYNWIGPRMDYIPGIDGKVRPRPHRALSRPPHILLTPSAHPPSDLLKPASRRPHESRPPHALLAPQDDGQPRVLASFMTALMKDEPLVRIVYNSIVSKVEPLVRSPPWRQSAAESHRN